MTPSAWLYHLSLSTMLARNGFLDPTSRADPRPPRSERAPRNGRLAAAGAAVLVRLALLATTVLHGWA